MNLPVDAHVHTNLSPDSDVPIDVYAALAVKLGIAEFAVTDHIDFDARDPAWNYSTYAQRERNVRDAAERWAEHGLAIRFGAELTYNTSWDADLRDHLARHAYDFTIGSVHDWPDSPYIPSRVRTWASGRSLSEVVEPYIEQVTAAARTGLFDTIGHIDVVKRYLHPQITPAQLAERPDLFEPALAALVESGTGLEVNVSGLHHVVAETYPPASVVARFRELGGTRLTTGSDAHRPEWFAHRLDEAYRIAAEAGFREVTFRRGPGGPLALPIPEQFAAA